ncbi:MAG TPA: bifunctional transaldolase/phosoglucose isomerase [Gemmatimonadales bacterium]|nr:bifunctional transaldolase/phosoglucose isomerase [Gemmatimonadales bacterium]
MSKVATKTPMQELLDLGQSVWLDYLRRGMLQSGELQRLIDDGLRGMTSNPTIFEHAIGGSSDYDEALARVAASPRSDRAVFELLAVDDVRAAADLFRPAYDASDGADGFVSLEVSPALARDTAGTVAEARRLWAAVDRPNVMIKVPGTREGWPAIERLLTEGVNVNITLLFSLEHYRAVAEAFLRALETRRAARQPIDRIASVASFFVSRVDTEVDRRLDAAGGNSASGLRGKVAIANAQLAYAWFRDQLVDRRWRALAEAGAKPQRLLWASTGTKDPTYSDVLYVDSLIGPHTINTVPPQTLQLFEDHGTVRATLPGDVAAARRVFERLGPVMDFNDVTRVLEQEGVEKFAHSFDTLLGVIATKRKALMAAMAPPRHSAEVRAFDQAVNARLAELEQAGVPKRIWSRDPTVWKPDPATPEIGDRLGWLGVGEMMAQQVKRLAAFAEEVRSEFDRVVLLGMGGSSLAPEVLWRTFGRRAGYPALTVLDSTDPRAVSAVASGGAIARTLFLVSSKSGTTQETDCLFRYFWESSGHRGAQFVAVTDPDTALAQLAGERGFRRTFLNPKDIGGRYSALSYFGLVPAALLGIDVGELLHRAHRMAEACAAWVPARQSPAAWLGAILGEAALAGRNKATFVLSSGIGSLGLWVEQLIAESTGKEGTGIVPVAEEPLGAPDVYGRDRLFVALTLAGEASDATDAQLRALTTAGHPVVRLTLEDRYDLGQEFFRWEFATAVAGAILRINAFDQPNVAESKQNTKDVLAHGQPPTAPGTAAELDRLLAGVAPGDYLALMAYLPPTPENDRRLAAARLRLRDRLKVATTLGYGPRFLHSTGQLHKGGPPVGRFVQITERVEQDVSIPGVPYTFGQLEAAQAEGDLRALRKRGRPAVRIDSLTLLER